jgi:hypothetical protein
MLSPRQNLMLAALSGGGERATYTPVQVQKLFFLIDREAAVYLSGPHFNFKPYDYGPFDKAVYDELQYLTKIGLADIVQGDRARLYMLTAEGYAIGHTGNGEDYAKNSGLHQGLRGMGAFPQFPTACGRDLQQI